MVDAMWSCVYGVQMLMTTAEVAEKTGATVRTVARWAESGKLKPLKKLSGARGAYVFDGATVESFMKHSLADKPRYVRNGAK